MSSKIFFVTFCIFIDAILAGQHCHFKYHSFHVGEDLRESRKNFTTELLQNCGEGKFNFKIMLREVWNENEKENLLIMLEIYLNKLLEHRPDVRTAVDITNIETDEIEIDHETLTKVTVSGDCLERVANWEMRCQVNLVFVIDSFRTKDLIKFKEFEEESEEEPKELNLAPWPDIVDWDNLYSADMIMMNEISGETDLPLLREEITEDFMFTQQP